MAAVIKHVRRRGDGYEYHRRVPQDIVRDQNALEAHFNGAKLFRRSLGTRNVSELLMAAEEKRLEFEGILAMARGKNMSSASSMRIAPLKTVTAAMLAEIAEEHRLRIRRPWVHAYIQAEQSPEHIDVLEQMVHEREMFAEETKALLVTQGMRGTEPNRQSPIQMAEELVDSRGLDAPARSVELSQVALAIRNGIKTGHADIDKILEGDLPATPTGIQVAPTSVSVGPTLRDATTRYLTDRSLRPKTQRDVLKSLEMFEDAIGNKRLVDLTRDDFARFIESLATKRVGGRSQNSIVRMIAPATVEKRLKFLRTAINHAIEKGMHNGGNPATNFDISAWVKAPDKSIMPSRRGFRTSEVKLVFEHPWFTGCASSTNTHSPGNFKLAGVHYWAPVVALLTGCRAAELGGLKLSEVAMDGEFPHLIIRDNEFRPTKKGYARAVPLLDMLMDHGFQGYVERIRASGADRLFPDWKPPKKAGAFNKDDAAWSNADHVRAFNRTVINHTLGQFITKGSRSEVTFHSFRGAFKSMLGLSRHGVAPNVINEVVGHAKNGMDQRYIGTVPLEETYPSIRSCTYEGLVLPDAP